MIRVSVGNRQGGKNTEDMKYIHSSIHPSLHKSAQEFGVGKIFGYTLF